VSSGGLVASSGRVNDVVRASVDSVLSVDVTDDLIGDLVARDEGLLVALDALEFDAETFSGLDMVGSRDNGKLRRLTPRTIVVVPVTFNHSLILVFHETNRDRQLYDLSTLATRFALLQRRCSGLSR